MQVPRLVHCSHGTTNGPRPAHWLIAKKRIRTRHGRVGGVYLHEHQIAACCNVSEPPCNGMVRSPTVRRGRAVGSPAGVDEAKLTAPLQRPGQEAWGVRGSGPRADTPRSAYAARLLPNFGSTNLPRALGDADESGRCRCVAIDGVFAAQRHGSDCAAGPVLCGDGNAMNGGGERWRCCDDPCLIAAWSTACSRLFCEAARRVLGDDGIRACALRALLSVGLVYPSPTYNRDMHLEHGYRGSRREGPYKL
jgi:hypothetical protein